MKNLLKEEKIELIKLLVEKLKNLTQSKIVFAEGFKLNQNVIINGNKGVITEVFSNDSYTVSTPGKKYKNVSFEVLSEDISVENKEVLKEGLDTIDGVYLLVKGILRTSGFRLKVDKYTKDVVVTGELDMDQLEAVANKLIGKGFVKSTNKDFKGIRYITYRSKNNLFSVLISKPIA